MFKSLLYTFISQCSTKRAVSIDPHFCHD